MNEKQHSRKIGTNSDDYVEGSSLRPPSREESSGNNDSNTSRQSDKEHPGEKEVSPAACTKKGGKNHSEGVPSLSRPPLTSGGKKGGSSGKENRKGPSFICINDKEEETQELSDPQHSSAKEYEVASQEQQPCHGAVAVRGPGFASLSDQSVAGTIVVGDDNEEDRQEHHGLYTETVSSSTSNENLVVAAEVAPTEQDVVAQMEERIRETEHKMEQRFQQLMDNAPRAEAVPMADGTENALPLSVEEEEKEGETEIVVKETDDEENATNFKSTSHVTSVLHNIQSKLRGHTSENAKTGGEGERKRLRYFVVFFVIILIVVGIILGVVLSKKDGNDESTKAIIQCDAETPCNFNHADGTCTNGQCLINTCDFNYGNCNGDATDGCEIHLQINMDHCGYCDTICNRSNAISKCVGGQCVVDSCMAGFTNCDGESVTGCEANLQKDINHCGSCGNVCDLLNADSRCVGGECVIHSCIEGFDNCVGNSSTGCETNLQTNVNHCGSCEKICALPNGDSKCVEGKCEVDNCLDGFASCDDKFSDSCETNLQIDENNCGSCDTICDFFNANSKCEGGICSIDSCMDGFTNCDGQSTTGCEVNLQTDANNCGSCDNICNLLSANSICVGGQCVIDSCLESFTNCDDKSSTGCEVNLQTDENHCGACGNSCNLPNANSKCVGGQCVVDSCLDNFSNCDGNSNSGCEINLQTDVNNCGSCGKGCNLPNANSKCVGGDCTINSCTADFGDCDDKVSTGCETNLQTAVNNCGVCGNSCNLANAYSNCAGGQCLIKSCLDGFDNCDGKSSTGCERNLQTDVNHCGTCGDACNLANANLECNGGSCAIASCFDGFGNCDGMSSTGCETDLNSNDNHCGSCDTQCNIGNPCVDRVCVNIQRDALITLYESTNGPNWDNGAEENWASSNVDECLWYGVECAYGKITKLEIGFNDLEGTIPTDIGDLTELTYLALRNNFRLSGTIPSTLGNLTKLISLLLDQNTLNGRVPTEFGKLTNMQLLWLWNNLLTGTLPSEMASMTKLTSLYVDTNEFDSVPSEICNMDIASFLGDCASCPLGCCTSCF